MLGFDNLLIKELPVIINVEQLREQFKHQKQERPPISDQQLSETEYQLGSERGSTLLNES